MTQEGGSLLTRAGKKLYLSPFHFSLVISTEWTTTIQIQVFLFCCCCFSSSHWLCMQKVKTVIPVSASWQLLKLRPPLLRCWDVCGSFWVACLVCLLSVTKSSSMFVAKHIHNKCDATLHHLTFVVKAEMRWELGKHINATKTTHHSNLHNW